MLVINYSYNESQRDALFLSSSILTTLADANITSMTNAYYVYTVLRYS